MSLSTTTTTTDNNLTTIYNQGLPCMNPHPTRPPATPNLTLRATTTHHPFADNPYNSMHRSLWHDHHHNCHQQHDHRNNTATATTTTSTTATITTNGDPLSTPHQPFPPQFVFFPHFCFLFIFVGLFTTSLYRVVFFFSPDSGYRIHAHD